MTDRVLIVVQNAPIEGDKRVQRELSTLISAGYQASLICPDLQIRLPRLALENVNILRYKPPRSGAGLISYLREYLVSLHRILLLTIREYRRTRFKVIQACNPPDMLFILGRMLRPLGVRFVFDQHDPSPEVYLSRFAKPRRIVYLLMRLCEYLSYRTADAVLVTNDSARAVALARGHVSPERVYVVRNGPYLTPSDSLPACPETCKGRYRYVVCCMGWIAPQDGVDYFIDAAHHIVNVQRRDDTRFLIIGDGSQLKQLRQRAADLKIADHVLFTGYVSDEGLLKAYLKMSDVCVSPEPRSLCNDKMTFIKVLDYMAAGRPIVAFDLPETRASAENSALYARPNDIADLSAKITLLLDNAPMRRTMGDYGRKRVEKSLMWDHSKTNLLRAYGELLRQA